MASFYTCADALIERDGEYLMIQEGKERCRKTWNIPGGGVEQGESPVEAIKREVKEEAGLNVENVEGLLGAANGRSTQDGHPVVVFIFKCSVEEGTPDPELKDEIMDATFMSKEEIMEKEQDEELRNDIVIKAFEMSERGLLPAENFSGYSHPYLDEEP